MAFDMMEELKLFTRHAYQEQFDNMLYDEMGRSPYRVRFTTVQAYCRYGDTPIYSRGLAWQIFHAIYS